MPFRLGPIAPVLLALISAQAALGIMTPLIPILLLRVGASSPAIGLVASAYYVGFLAGALSCDRIVTRVGHIRAFAVFAAIAADASLMLVFSESAWQVAGLRLLIGFASSGMFLVVESWLNDRADASNRGRAFGAYLVASWGASALGPLALSVTEAAPVMFVLAGAGFATALLPMALTRQANPEVRPQAHFALLRLYRVSPIGVACCLGSGLINGAYYGMVPVYLQRQSFGSSSVAAFISAAMIAGLLVQYPAGALSDRFGRRPLMLGTLGAGFLLAVAMAFFGGVSLLIVNVLGFAFAFMTAPLYGLGAGQTNDRMERGDYVAASGGLLFTWSLGSTLGPSLAGALMGRIGPSGLFAYLALVLAALGIFTWARMMLRSEVPRDRRRPYVPAFAAPPRHSEMVSSVAATMRYPVHGADTILQGALHPQSETPGS
jgi:MFS family permease